MPGGRNAHMSQELRVKSVTLSSDRVSTFNSSLLTVFMFGASTNGKSGDFGSPIWRFESSRPSQAEFVEQIPELEVKS